MPRTIMHCVYDIAMTQLRTQADKFLIATQQIMHITIMQMHDSAAMYLFQANHELSLYRHYVHAVSWSGSVFAP